MCDATRLYHDAIGASRRTKNVYMSSRDEEVVVGF
jgi:hypothetical protein